MIPVGPVLPENIPYGVSMRGNGFYAIDDRTPYDTFSFAFWFRLLPEGEIPILFYRFEDYQEDFLILLNHFPATQTVEIRTGRIGQGHNFVHTIADYDPMEWTYLALTVSDERINLYINGEHDETFEEICPDPVTEPLGVLFGGYAPKLVQTIDGWEMHPYFQEMELTDFRMYKKALNPKTIQAAYRDMVRNDGRNTLPWRLQ